jgi:hypothetical protein
VIVTARLNILFCVLFTYLLLFADGLWKCSGAVTESTAADLLALFVIMKGAPGDRKTTDK